MPVPKLQFELTRNYPVWSHKSRIIALICSEFLLTHGMAGMTGEMTEMAISSYLGGLLLLMGSYPFLLVGVSMFFYDSERQKALRWLNGVSFLLAAFLHFCFTCICKQRSSMVGNYSKLGIVIIQKTGLSKKHITSNLSRQPTRGI